jgi:glycosyltransferase involved in cell wall biosynthesis
MTSSESLPERPLVTIAIPTFNRASWLKGCVDSALSQTHANFEVLVSDNASTDETPAVLKEFNDPRLRILRQQSNIGIMPNWNACLAAAKGEFIVFVPDDDRIAPWMLDRCAGLLAQESQLVMVMALNDLHLTGEGRILPPAKSKTLGTGIHEGADIFLEYLRGNLSVQLCSLMMRTDLLRQGGGFANDWPYAGDTAAWGRILMTGRAGLVNESCATFAWHDESATSQYTISGRRDSGRRLVAELDEAADRHVADPAVRRGIKRQARGYVARDLVGAIASYRRNGGSLAAALPLIWQCRSELLHSGIATSDGSDFARLCAIIVLPRFALGFVARIRQALRTRTHRASEHYRSTNA